MCQELLKFRQDALGWTSNFQMCLAMRTPTFKDDLAFKDVEGVQSKLEAWSGQTNTLGPDWTDWEMNHDMTPLDLTPGSCAGLAR